MLCGLHARRKLGDAQYVQWVDILSAEKRRPEGLGKMTIRFACPTCSKPIEVPDDQGATVTGCMECGERVRVPRRPWLPAQSKTANVYRPAKRDPAAEAPPKELSDPFPAIVACRDCEGQVSETAYNCPHCGGSLRHQPVNILAVVLLVLIAISFIPAILAFVAMFGSAAGAALKH